MIVIKNPILNFTPVLLPIKSFYEFTFNPLPFVNRLRYYLFSSIGGKIYQLYSVIPRYCFCPAAWRLSGFWRHRAIC